MRLTLALEILAATVRSGATDLPRRDLHRFPIDATSRDTLMVRTGEIESLVAGKDHP